MAEPQFLQDEKTQDAVVRNFEIIGEAARNVERHHPEFAISNPEVPWDVMYTMRNRVAHGYFKVDYEIVWRTIHADLPELRAQVAAPSHSSNSGAAGALAPSVRSQSVDSVRLSQRSTHPIHPPRPRVKFKLKQPAIQRAVE